MEAQKTIKENLFHDIPVHWEQLFNPFIFSIFDMLSYNVANVLKDYIPSIEVRIQCYFA